MNNTMFSVEKLGDSNYDSWCVQVKSVLVFKELWDVVTGVLQQPKAEEDNSNASEVKAWKSTDEKAMAFMMLSLTPVQIAYVKQCKTSKEVWNVLREIHRPKGPARKVSLFKELLGLRMAEGEQVQLFLSNFSTLLDKLAEIGVDLQEELFVIMLLASLPKSFENLVVALESRDELPKLYAERYVRVDALLFC